MSYKYPFERSRFYQTFLVTFYLSFVCLIQKLTVSTEDCLQLESTLCYNAYSCSPVISTRLVLFGLAILKDEPHQA